MSNYPEAIEQAPEIQLPAGKTVFYSGAECSNYLVVTQGSVKVFTLSDQGREVVLYHVREGNSCVLTTSCLLGHADYPAEAVTETPVTARILPKGEFNHQLAQSASFRQFVFDNFSHHITGLISKVGQLAFDRIEKRLAGYLLEHEQQGMITATHQGIALEIGSVREVVSRKLKRFANNGWLNLDRGKIQLLNKPALNQLAGEKS